MDNGANISCLCLAFTNKVIELYKYLQEKGEKILSERLLRSGLEVGVRVSCAQNALGFLCSLDRFDVALLFTNDTLYWVDLLLVDGHITEEQYCEIKPLGQEIRCFLISQIVLLKTMK